MKRLIYIIFIYIILTTQVYAQNIEKEEEENTSKSTYKKRVLETIEMDLLSSYYSQVGDNAAVSGGIGTEELEDVTGTIIVSIPLNDDDVFTIDAGISAYSSASSSNVNPFDGRNQADAFVASSGESQSDVWSNVSLSYSHSSDDRNKIYGANLSFSSEYDYTSVGFGGSYSTLFNEKNTEFNLKASAFFDQWNLLYPAELRSFGLMGDEGDDDENFNINRYTISGNANYAPNVKSLESSARNSYAVGMGYSQILSKRLQASISTDLVFQQGQLSTPFQRVYFKDVENSYIENFHLADDIERLPNQRIKFAIGGRLHLYINEAMVLRTFYRYYQDDWNLLSHTASIELPIKILQGKMAIYPSYRYYQQSAAKFFAPYDEHLSTDEFYTSDYDLSKFNAHQYGLGLSYNNLYSSKKLWKFGFKSIDLKYYYYDRDSNFSSHLITLGVKFSMDGFSIRK